MAFNAPKSFQFLASSLAFDKERQWIFELFEYELDSLEPVDFGSTLNLTVKSVKSSRFGGWA